MAARYADHTVTTCAAFTLLLKYVGVSVVAAWLITMQLIRMIDLWNGAPTVIEHRCLVREKRVFLLGQGLLAWTVSPPGITLSLDIASRKPVDVYVARPQGLEELVKTGETAHTLYVIQNVLELRKAVELPDSGPWVVIVDNKGWRATSVDVLIHGVLVQ